MLYQMGDGETERDTLSIIKLPPKEDAKTTFIVYLFFKDRLGIFGILLFH